MATTIKKPSDTKVTAASEQAVRSWDEMTENVNGGRTSIGTDKSAGDEDTIKRIRIGIVGKNYLSQSVKVSADPKSCELLEIEGTKELDSLIEWRPNLVFICTDIPLLKNDSLDDAEFINTVSKISKQTEAGVCIKTSLNIETFERLVSAVGIDSVMNKLIYSPEIEETLEGVLNSETVLVGGYGKALESHVDVLTNLSTYLMKNVITGSFNTIIFTKLGLSGWKAVKQTYFNQLHNAIMDIGGANPSTVRRNILKSKGKDDHLVLPVFFRSQSDDSVTLKQARAYGGEYLNSDVKMFVSMIDKLPLLEECINLRNLKD